VPVAAVEIEVSLQAYEQQTKDGKHYHSFFLHFLEAHQYSVIATCKELGIAVVAYSYAPSQLSLSSPPPETPPTARSVVGYSQVRSRAEKTLKKEISGAGSAVSRRM
jgi:hypothetical protein